jgi:hypothetical protein
MRSLDRVLLLLTSLLAAYQVVQGVEGFGALAITSYTIGFGVLVVAGLMMIILGFEVLDSPLVVIVSSIIPLSLSLGLVSEHLPTITIPYLVFTLAGFLGIIITRYTRSGRLAVYVLAIAHGISGLLIFALPITFSLQKRTPIGFSLVGVGGALIGIGGLLLFFHRAGKPVLSRETILRIFPLFLFLTTSAFVVGFALG